MNFGVENIAGFKFWATLTLLERKQAFASYLVYVLINCSLIVGSVALTVLVAPAAAGSGIAEVKVRKGRVYSMCLHQQQHRQQLVVVLLCGACSCRAVQCISSAMAPSMSANDSCCLQKTVVVVLAALRLLPHGCVCLALFPFFPLRSHNTHLPTHPPHQSTQAYLNGIDVPSIFFFKTLVVKLSGSVGAVAGGLAVGKEGP